MKVSNCQGDCTVNHEQIWGKFDTFITAQPKNPMSFFSIKNGKSSDPGGKGGFDDNRTKMANDQFSIKFDQARHSDTLANGIDFSMFDIFLILRLRARPEGPKPLARG